MDPSRRIYEAPNDRWGNAVPPQTSPVVKKMPVPQAVVCTNPNNSNFGNVAVMPPQPAPQAKVMHTPQVVLCTNPNNPNFAHANVMGTPVVPVSNTQGGAFAAVPVVAAVAKKVVIPVANGRNMPRPAADFGHAGTIVRGQRPA